MLIYLGPDVLMPIASILGAIGGAILLFWNRVVDLVRAVLGRPRSTDEGAEAEVEEALDPASTSRDRTLEGRSGDVPRAPPATP
jgi:hypothetical protein